MEKTFYTPPRDRAVTVKISDDWITFHFRDEGDREFYHIPPNEWISDRTNRLDRGDNWHTHMNRKGWFTDEIYSFIETNL